MAVDRFVKAIFIQPPCVMGRQLRPFSAYHLAALTLIDSPFMSGGEKGITDLILAAFVCSYGFEDGPSELFPEPDLEPIIEWGNKNKDFSFDDELEVFREYYNDYLDLPEVWPNGEGKLSEVPSCFHTVSTVLQFMSGITRAEAWDMPFSELYAYKCAIAEEHGYDLVNQKLAELAAETDALAEKMKQSENANG